MAKKEEEERKKGRKERRKEGRKEGRKKERKKEKERKKGRNKKDRKEEGRASVRQVLKTYQHQTETLLEVIRRTENQCDSVLINATSGYHLEPLQAPPKMQ